MIVTNNAVYLHIPKTAGVWVKNVLEPISIELNAHGLLFKKPTQKYIYAFIRNPWDWYYSFYQFHFNGSDVIRSEYNVDALFTALPDSSFSCFIENVCNPSDSFKNKVLSIERARNLDLDNILQKDLKNNSLRSWGYYIRYSWCKTSNISLYQHFVNTYTKFTTRVGQVENLKEDLKNMVIESNDASENIINRIENLPPINVTKLRSNYQDFYDDYLQKLVTESSLKIISEYRYKF